MGKNNQLKPYFDAVLKYPHNVKFDLEEDIHFLLLWEQLDKDTKRDYIENLLEELKGNINTDGNKTNYI